MRLRRLIPFLAIAVAGCAERGTEFGPGATLRDSAGVSIIQNREPAWHADSIWRVGEGPTLELGGPEGIAVGEVVGLVRTEAGAIAAADGRAQIIRVFAPDGRLVRSVGRQGSGPGEFQALAWLGAHADSLLAFDLLTRRVTLFGTGRPRITQLQAQGPALTAPLGRFGDGTLLVVSGGAMFPFAGGEGDARRDSAQLLRFGADGVVRDTLVRIAWGETFGVAIGSGEGRFLAPMPRPFGRRTSVVLAGEEVVIGEADRYEVKVVDASGKLLRRIRRPHDPVPVTPEAIAAYKATIRLPTGSRGLQARIDSALMSALDSAPFPATLPAYERVLVDEGGNIWVLEYAVRLDQPRRWSVFTREGQWLGDVLTPPGLRVKDIGEDWILGVWRDAEGAERIRMHALMRPGADRRPAR
ncbi:MAG TPA: hypothetical protein VFT04_00860 [Gemmatimonadales bacterium]|nr:hypothetical protein [Gemmatimonadales bacterium]